MSRQLNLTVSDEFARKLERVARSTGQPMAAVLEALAAWEEYQLSGGSVSAGTIEGLFGDALVRARARSKRRAR